MLSGDRNMEGDKHKKALFYFSKHHWMWILQMFDTFLVSCGGVAVIDVSNWLIEIEWCGAVLF